VNKRPLSLPKASILKMNRKSTFINKRDSKYSGSNLNTRQSNFGVIIILKID